MEANLGTRAATRQSWSRDSIRQVFRSIQEENSKAGHDRLVKLLGERLVDDPDALEAACDYIVTTFLNTQESYRAREPSARPRTTPTPQEIEERKQAITATAESIKSQVMLLNLEMPNGKRARYCTGAELVKFGGAWVKIGKKVGNTRLLGSVMDEKEVRRLME